MAGLMSRTALIIKSKYSALLNRSENPTQTLDYSYEQMLEQLQNVKRGTADVVTAKKRIELQQALQSKIESFRSQKEILKAQYSAAEAQVKVGEAATGIGKNMQDTGLAIERAKDKTEQMQARASAIDELTSSGALEDFTTGDQTQLDRELAQISSAAQVDDELAKLKAEVGSGGAQKEIAAGDGEPATDAADEQPAAQPADESSKS